ncbi:hypothetical protein HNP84_003693 [Thermocatellispora tengchongensis]|uniref:Uncharacterized protein n=1 Tax=Thermocatellispora tengchongensis TaxID=1073253 RepID=A0A840P9T6_9ACTN|nr:hypothetical protein [Thermocatellispora tengchongensis]MBB5133967.1 hypothetical protein [Thermocatellispora tengchongensis]
MSRRRGKHEDPNRGDKDPKKDPGNYDQVPQQQPKDPKQGGGK